MKEKCDYKQIIDNYKSALGNYKKSYERKEVGRVVFSGDGVAKIEGLQKCKYGELLEIDGHIQAIALNIEEHSVGAIILGDHSLVSHGAIVHATDNIVTVPVGEQLLGRVVDPLGRPIDGLAELNFDKCRPIEARSPEIIDRSKVNRPLQTGVLAVDSMIPIGRGQREVIIGDRQTGKTSLALDTILNQKGQGVLCVYVSIGQKASTISGIMHMLLKAGAMEYTTIVVATASDSSPIQYIAPYSGCAIAEEFMYSGKDVLIVYDDLTKHAVAYREMSLLLKRPSGRESFPGDVFYLHSRLLERAAKLSDELGGGSITAIPIIETVFQNLSTIPSNVVSITDGQIYLDTDLFNSGVLPAINVGLSVSRVGSTAQLKAMQRVSKNLRLELSQYRETAVFAQFSSDLDDDAKKTLDKGARTVEILKQDKYSPLPIEKQICILYITLKGMLSQIDGGKLQLFKKEFLEYLDTSFSDLLSEIKATGDLSTQLMIKLDKATKRFIEFHFNQAT